MYHKDSNLSIIIQYFRAFFCIKKWLFEMYRTATKLFYPRLCLLAIGIFAVGELFDVEALIHDGIAAVGEV